MANELATMEMTPIWPRPDKALLDALRKSDRSRHCETRIVELCTRQGIVSEEVLTEASSDRLNEDGEVSLVPDRYFSCSAKLPFIVYI